MNFQNHPSPGKLRFIAILFLLGVAGCGVQEYEQRLAETSRYFEFRERQDQLLAPEWAGPGVKLRVPKLFTIYPSPPPENIRDDQGNVVPNPNFQGDNRQPTYISATLPGLVAGWQGTIESTTSKTLPCYLYLCSNREIWLEERAAERATEFHKSVIDSVTGPLGIFIQEDDWDTEKFPKANGYLVPKSYTFTTKAPEQSINGESYAVSFYLHQVQDIQVALVLVMPQNVDPRSKFEESLTFCLQTLDVSGEKPRKDGGSGTATPSGANF